MSGASLILDTNILWNLDLCNRLTERIVGGDLRVFIPTLVHAERIRQIAEQYGAEFAIDVVRQFIADARFDLLPLTTEHAEEVGDVWRQLRDEGRDKAYWHTHRFDIVICAVARSSGCTLVTDETGSHFDLVPDRIDTTKLQTVLGETQD